MTTLAPLASPPQVGNFRAGRAPLGKIGGDTTTTPDQARARRYRLQAVARSIFPDDQALDGCMRARIPGREGVKVFRQVEHNSASFGGLVTCGNCRACPVCAAKVAERRREELEQAIATHRANGGTIFLVTFTLAHDRGDHLAPLLEAFIAAEGAMKKGGAYGRLMKRVGLLGTVRALEITIGRANGFHPHAHVLYFVAGDADRADFEATLFPLWERAAARHGRTMNHHGLDVQETDLAVGAYVGKWGAAAELTRPQGKAGRGASFTPFQLLDYYAETGERWARNRFAEYVTATKGRAFLRYSNGLKAALGLAPAEKTDEEVAAEIDKGGELVCEIAPATWALVKKHEARARVLTAAAHGGRQAVVALLQQLWDQEACGAPQAIHWPTWAGEVVRLRLG